MSLANPEDFQFSLEEQFEGRLFTRRTDLSNDIRLLIGTNALHAMLNRAWGTITHLADEYGISRTFIYSLANSIKKIGQFLFKEATLTSHASSLREHAIQTMLSLRLEGRSSIGAISTMMNRFDCDLSSTGSISQTLSQIGGFLPMTVSSETSIIHYLVFASDEIFSKSAPILITVDPCSSAILRMELADSRNADDWKSHFESLNNNGIEAIYLVSDDGNIADTSKTGRLRWKIENEGFNTLKNGGYGMEHQYARKSYTALKNYFQFMQMAHITHQLMTLNTRFHEAFLNAKNHPTLKNLWLDLVAVMQWLELDEQELERINSTRRQFRFAI